MSLEEDWGNCRACDTPVGRGDAVRVVLREEGTVHSTVLCPDCAVIQCDNCGSAVALSSALEEDRRGGHWTVTCNRCEENVPLEEALEIRNERDPNYRKIICADCFEQLSVPEGYTVHRDVAPP